jgi:hypothetical protein
MPPPQARCAYCGFDELEVCSPFVVGQCRAEHDAYILRCKPIVADHIIPEKKGTTVKFCIDGDYYTPSEVDVPYFPPVHSQHGEQLLSQAEGERREAMIVHEICALQMFQARMDRNR